MRCEHNLNPNPALSYTDPPWDLTLELLGEVEGLSFIFLIVSLLASAYSLSVPVMMFLRNLVYIQGSVILPCCSPLCTAHRVLSLFVCFQQQIFWLLLHPAFIRNWILTCCYFYTSPKIGERKQVPLIRQMLNL